MTNDNGAEERETLIAAIAKADDDLIRLSRDRGLMEERLMELRAYEAEGNIIRIDPLLGRLAYIHHRDEAV